MENRQAAVGGGGRPNRQLVASPLTPLALNKLPNRTGHANSVDPTGSQRSGDGWFLVFARLVLFSTDFEGVFFADFLCGLLVVSVPAGATVGSVWVSAIVAPKTTISPTTNDCNVIVCIPESRFRSAGSSEVNASTAILNPLFTEGHERKKR